MQELKKNIHVENNILSAMEKIQTLDKNSIEYNQLRDKIINVGEYKNVSETK